jgi:hypothetical protein
LSLIIRHFQNRKINHSTILKLIVE